MPDPAPDTSPGLLVVDEPDGSRALVVSNDPVPALLTTDGVTQCSCCGGACSTIRRFNACPLPAEFAGCVNQPDHLWICEDATCFAGPGSPITTVQVGNRCYSRTAITLPREQLPEGETLAPGPFQCRTSCNDDGPPLGQVSSCTECQLFYIANPCLENASCCPTLYVAAENIIAPCGLVTWSCAGPDGRTHPCCYTVGWNSSKINHAQLPPGAAVSYVGSAPGFDCCDCIEGCGHRISQWPDCRTGSLPRVPLRCCCSDTFTLTVYWNVREVFTRTGPQWLSLQGTTQTITWRGTRTIRYINGVPQGDPANLLSEVVSVDTGEAVGNWRDQVAVPTWLCAGQARLLHGFFLTPRCPSDLGGQTVVLNEEFGRYEILAAYASQECTSATSGGSWRGTNYNADGSEYDRFDMTSAWQASITEQGRCGGGCTGNGTPLLPGRGGLPRDERGGSLPDPVAPPVTSSQPVREGRLPDGSAAALLFLRGGN